MASHKTPKKEKKPWWETLGGLAGAILAVGALAGGIYQFVLPRQTVAIRVVEGSWKPGDAKANEEESMRPHKRWVLTDANRDAWEELKGAGSRYFYEFDLELRNTGNRTVKMSEGQKTPIYVVANVPRRPGVQPPSIELQTHVAMTGDVKAASMLNNVLQVTLSKLPLFGRAVIHVTLLSPIEDLGGVNLFSDDPTIKVDPAPSSSVGGGPAEIRLSNNLLPARVTAVP